MKIKSLSVLLLMVPMFMFSQTKEEREKIASFSNKEANAILAKQLQEDDSARKIRVNNYLQNNPDVKKVVKVGSTITEIMDVLPNGEIVYAKTYNEGAAVTARANKLYSGGGMGLNIQGQNMIAGVWDGGNVRSTHQEFMVGATSKVVNGNFSPVEDHPTHVAGTIAAQGITPGVRGVAFNSNILAYDWGGDLAEMLTEAGNGLLVSNHSYGIGSLSSLWFFGAYDSRAQQMDQITYNNPFYLPVVSAGNDRNSTTPPASTQLSTKQGYDLVKGHANAKNVMTVAAVNGVTSYVDPSSVVLSNFTSWGPSDDGRIKPEIAMKGVDVYSSLGSSNTAVGYQSGTSMSSPGITGVVVLLQQYYNQLYSSYMRAATVKGLIMHTADEAGFDNGPDYQSGWGLVNTESAAKLIRDKNLLVNRSIIEENTLANNATFTKTIVASGTQPLQISISWTDPAYGTPNNGTVDPTTKYLVNDLDIKVTSLAGVDYYPWKLQGMSNTLGSATNVSTNNVDNFERIDIPNPLGTYTITVTHKGTLTASQNFSLIASSGNLGVLLSAADTVKTENEISFYPNPANDILYIKNNNSVEANVSILDASGRILKQQNVKNGEINVQNLEKGIYLLIYKDKKERETSAKFIKN